MISIALTILISKKCLKCVIRRFSSQRLFFSGSGKSYTMMGTMEEKGIIPRLCDALFDRIARLENETTSFKVEVSYLEIYNEKVHDLLDLKG
jgi:kinesin family protein 13